MTYREKIKKTGLEVLSRAGILEYDCALPQPWVDDFIEKTGAFPMGIIWLYDKGYYMDTGVFGAPFAITLQGHILLTKYKLANERREK